MDAQEVLFIFIYINLIYKKWTRILGHPAWRKNDYVHGQDGFCPLGL